MWIEVVGWDDATGYSQWMPLPDAQTKQTERCYTVGWVIFEDAQRIILVQSRGASLTDSVDHIMVIPKGMVVSRRKLQKWK